MNKDTPPRRAPSLGWKVLNLRLLREPPEWVAAVVYILLGLLVVPLFFYLLGVVTWRLVAEAWVGEAAAVNQLMLGLAGLFGAPFLVWRVIIAARSNTIAQDSVHTNLLTKAVEQLGATRETKDTKEHAGEDGKTRYDTVTKTVPNREVRIGALYALEKLANDYEPLHWQIMDILCSYVRYNCQPEDDWGSAGTLGAKPSDHRFDNPRVDIQTALTILGCRSQRRKEAEQKLRAQEHDGRPLYLNLARASLRGATLNAFDLSHADFSYSSLEVVRAAFASFAHSLFQNSDLRNSVLYSASFASSLILDSDFSQAQLSLSDFGSATTERCKFVRVVFDGAIFENASFKNCDFSGASFIKSELPEADFSFCNLERTNFQGANVQRSSFTNSWLDAADLSEAHGLSFAQVESGWGSHETKLPRDFPRPKNNRWLEPTASRDRVIEWACDWSAVSRLTPNYMEHYMSRGG